MRGQLGRKNVGPPCQEILVMERILNDDISHGQGDHAVRSWLDGEPFVTSCCGAREPGVQGHQLAALHPPFDQPLNEGDKEGVALVRVGSKVEDVPGTRYVVKLQLGSPGEPLGDGLVALVKMHLLAGVRRAKGPGETPDNWLGPLKEPGHEEQPLGSAAVAY